MLQLNYSKYILPTLLTASSLVFSSSSFSQTYNIPKNKQYPTLDENIKSHRSNLAPKVFGGAQDIYIQERNQDKANEFSEFQINKLNNFLKNEQYPNFYEYINSINITEDGILSYLLSKTTEGHIPVYWMLAHLYSLEKQQENTHKWFYVALIMTEQDADICSDSSAKIASKTLLRNFHSIVDIINISPQYIVSSMKFAGDFVRKLSNRSDPKFVCSYGTNVLVEEANYAIPSKHWKQTRAETLKRILERYNLK